MHMATSTRTYAEWLELADEYYLATRSLQWFTALAYPTAYVGHHALELYLKALFVKETNTYPDKEHDLRILYDELVRIKSSYRSEAVELALGGFLHIDQTARYTSLEAKTPPNSNQMGTDLTNALDHAVFCMRDLNVQTIWGLDKLVNGEADPVIAEFKKHHLSLQSVILFHMNNAFSPKNSEYLKHVNFVAPSYPVTEDDIRRFQELQKLAELPDEAWAAGQTEIKLF